MSQSSKVVNQQILLGEDYISIWVETFLKERKAQNLANGTIKYYREKLGVFIAYLDAQEVKYINQITPAIIRDFLLILEERGHNACGVQGIQRKS